MKSMQQIKWVVLISFNVAYNTFASMTQLEYNFDNWFYHVIKQRLLSAQQ